MMGKRKDSLFCQPLLPPLLSCLSCPPVPSPFIYQVTLIGVTMLLCFRNSTISDGIWYMFHSNTFKSQMDTRLLSSYSFGLISTFFWSGFRPWLWKWYPSRCFISPALVPASRNTWLSFLRSFSTTHNTLEPARSIGTGLQCIYLFLTFKYFLPVFPPSFHFAGLMHSWITRPPEAIFGFPLGLCPHENQWNTRSAQSCCISLSPITLIFHPDTTTKGSKQCYLHCFSTTSIKYFQSHQMLDQQGISNSLNIPQFIKSHIL